MRRFCSRDSTRWQALAAVALPLLVAHCGSQEGRLDPAPLAGSAGARPVGGTAGGGRAQAGTSDPVAGSPTEGGATEPSAGTAGSLPTAGSAGEAREGGAGAGVADGGTVAGGAGGISSGSTGVSGGAGGSSDGGSGGTGGAIVNGCVDFVDGSTEKALRDLLWTELLATDPARCLRIQSGQSVTFRGDFTDHPIAPSGGDEPSPIVPFDGTPNRVELSFATPGLFGFICTVHPEMTGAILVEP